MFLVLTLSAMLQANEGKLPLSTREYNCVTNNGKEFKLEINGNRKSVKEGEITTTYYIKDLNNPNEVDDYLQITYKNKVITYSIKCSSVSSEVNS